MYSYYKKLFGKEECRNVHLGNVWSAFLRLTDAEKENMIRPFSLEKLDKNIKEMKANTSPGPDGFPVGFYKAMWTEFGGLIKEMLDDLHVGSLNTDRINYGVIFLLPKVVEAKTIKQYRPICLQNVILKILTKTINGLKQHSFLGGIFLSDVSSCISCKERVTWGLSLRLILTRHMIELIGTFCMR